MLTLNLIAAYPGVVALGRRPLAALLCEALGGEAAALVRSILIELHGWYTALAEFRDPATAVRCSAEPAYAARAIGLLAPYQVRPGRWFGCQGFSGTSGGNRAGRARGRAGLAGRHRAAIPVWPERAFDRCISALLGAASPPGDLVRAAGAVAASFRPVGRPCLYLDVSTIAGHDAGTGIQRVVRETVRQLSSHGRLALSNGAGARYRRGSVSRTRLRRTVARVSEPDGTDRLAEIGEDDVFLGLDLNMHDLSGLLRTIRSARQNGGRAVGVVIYDLLPIQMPACFPEPVQKLFPGLAGHDRSAR